MSPKLISLLIQIGIVAIVIATVVFGFRWWLAGHDEAVATAAALEQSKKTGQATSDIAGDASDGVADAAHTDHVVTESRVTFHHEYEEAKRENPTIADWSDDAIDQRLRDLARQRRLARERPGGSPARSSRDATDAESGWRRPASGERGNQ